MQTLKIQLQHPQGKKAIAMDESKYKAIESAIVYSLKSKKELAHKDLLKEVSHYFETKKIKFDGALDWHTEWVKLDMEARKVLKRSGENQKPVVYQLS